MPHTPTSLKGDRHPNRSMQEDIQGPDRTDEAWWTSAAARYPKRFKQHDTCKAHNTTDTHDAKYHNSQLVYTHHPRHNTRFTSHQMLHDTTHAAEHKQARFRTIHPNCPTGRRYHGQLPRRADAIPPGSRAYIARLKHARYTDAQSTPPNKQQCNTNHTTTPTDTTKTPKQNIKANFPQERPRTTKIRSTNRHPGTQTVHKNAHADNQQRCNSLRPYRQNKT